MDDTSPYTEANDPFESLLSLEQQYHTEGYQLGQADGARAGRIEGRIFGTEKGFEKFLEMGRLAGRASVWTARLAKPNSGDVDGGEARAPASERVTKHVRRLRELTDPETILTDNSEDAVSEFDDRLKDAKAKAKLISTLMVEDIINTSNDSSKAGTRQDGKVPSGSSKGLKGSGEMEDFAGLPKAAMKKKA
ncbi:hypothetical protein LTR09_003769 [Extremus antarcticus]|uniref:Essential protein Yae1 N-terminal domain-containing protein n=1 Tax=Extremus antarcticus TaxID=702011 RepID=A0AAJ0DR00_9PEZI|nr:hypothetical protein LTR09_003769 [Extremus antarcticus]